MDFNDVFLFKVDASNPQYLAHPGAGYKVSNSANSDAELGSIHRQADDLFTKVDKIGVELDKVQQFYLNVVKNQVNGSKETGMMKAKEILTSSAAKKNQTRAVAAKRRQELKLRQDKGRKDQEAVAQSELQLAQEVAHARTARRISNELHEADRHLEELREMVLRKSRKFSIEEKRQLTAAFGRLSTEHLIKALDIVTQSNPNPTGLTEEVDLDALSDLTLWRLKIFVKGALKIQGSLPAAHPSKDDDENINNKRKKKNCGAVAKTKRTKTDVVDK